MVTQADIVGIIDPAWAILVLCAGWRLKEEALKTLGVVARVKHALEATCRVSREVELVGQVTRFGQRANQALPPSDQPALGLPRG